MTAREILFKNLSKGCYWEDMDNLTNCPVSDVLKAMEEYAALNKVASSQRIIHSKPITGNFYWVQCFEDDQWEVAKCKEYNGKDHFYFTNGGRKECEYVSDWKNTPIG